MRNNFRFGLYDRILMKPQGGGGGGGGQQTVTNQTKLPDWIDNAGRLHLAQAYGVANDMLGPYQGPTYSGLTDGAVSNIAALQQNIGQTNPAYAYATNAAAGLSNYTPQQVSAMSVGAPSMVSAPTASAGTVQAGRISGTPTLTADQVQAGLLANTNLGSYMNPYTQNVIASGLSALDAQRLQAQNQNADAAIKAGAFGGSRHGVIEGVTNAAAAAQAGQLAAGLQQQNFSQAQQAAMADINRNLQAQLANQGANLTADQLTAGYGMQGAMANLDAGLRASLANQSTGLQASLANQQASLAAALANQQAQMQQGTINANLGMQAQLANQQAGLQGAGLNLQAANQVGNLATQGQNAYLQSLMAAMGGQQMFQQDLQGQYDAAQQAYQAAQQFPMQQLMIPIQALGMAPYGSTTTSTGPAPQQQQGSPWLQGIGALGTLAGAAGSLAPFFLPTSDRDLKTDIKKIGEDKETGLPLYSYRYKGDPKTYPKVVGPMAQDIEKMFPDQVGEVGGRKVVNMGFGPMARAFR